MDVLSASDAHPPSQNVVVDSQVAHRLNLVRVWDIQSGDKILDIGCGQGDCTVVLAQTVGPTGHVTGIDPGPPDYGSPYTLAAAQRSILDSPLGVRISFRRADAPEFLASEEGRAEFDVATLCHSLWYFDTRENVKAVFEALETSNVKRVCMAEYVGTARTPEQLPHELAATAQRRFHQLRKPDETLQKSNVRGALDPPELLAIAEGAGWKIKEQGVVEAPPGLLDGHWETLAATNKEFEEQVLAEKLSKELEDEVLGYSAKVKELVAELKARGAKTTTMDVAWAVLER